MILADKITEERKKLGLSQEELAQKLSVSRQAVSKWESAQSIPDLQKIIMMSEIFSVSTDYLLKDEMEPEKKITTESEPERNIRRVSMEDANEFMLYMKEQGKTIALGVLMCILSPVTLILLAGLSDSGIGGISETVAASVGMLLLFILIAAAVYLFIRCSTKSEKFAYLKKEEFETAYGVDGLVKEKKAEFEPIYTKFLSLAIILFVLSPVPLIITAILSCPDTIVVAMTSLLLCIVAVGVYMIIRVSMIKSSYKTLLHEIKSIDEQKKETFSGAYWCVATAIYLAWSFITNDWNMTWIVWPIAGVLFVPFKFITDQITGKK